MKNIDKDKIANASPKHIPDITFTDKGSKIFHLIN